MKRLAHTVLLMLALTAMLSMPALAREVTVDPTTQFTFSASDFTGQSTDEGVFLTAVPRSTTVRYGDRILRAGDALPTAALNQLTLETDCVTKQALSIGYVTVSGGTASGAKDLKLSILPKKNEPPVAEDGALETYRNIPNQGTLRATDPENGALTFTIETQPKRGAVELKENGAFTYTPNENKVGKDSFTFFVTDEAGNQSEPAKISIVIKKPTDKAVYADLEGDADAFSAMWMKEQGLYTGSTVGGNLCFAPDEAVDRGEFLVMAMQLVDAQASDSAETSGFADEADTPLWMRPYVVSALRNGMISGDQSEAGVVFRPDAELTRAEAAVMLQNMLQLPTADTQSVFAAQAAVPTWAQEASAAMAMAGIELTADGQLLTRRDAARVFYQVNQLLEAEAVPTFYWVQ